MRFFPDYAIYFSSYFIRFKKRNLPRQAVSEIVRSLVFGKVIMVCHSNCLCSTIPTFGTLSLPTSIIQFHFIPVIKTARQPFNHHTFCTPLTRHQHCSVNLVLTTPIIQFSTVIGFKVLLYHQNLFKTGFQSDLYCYQKPLYSSISFPYSIVPSFQLYRSIIPTLKRSSKKVFCSDCIFVSTNLFSILPTTFTTSQL